MNITLEVCTATLDSVVAAKDGGAQRIEFCSALSEDGLTPSYGMIEAARRLGPERMHVLIRPRGGDFVYNENEIQCMISDIRVCRQLGVDGVVIGALTPDGNIDMPTCQHLIDAAKGDNSLGLAGLQVTFHRAFDYCKDPLTALEQIISLGCHRLLTSGQAKTAYEGIPMLRQLVEQSNGRIIIMPASGVNENNAADILRQTGATEIHGSLRSMTPRGMETDVNKVRKITSL